MMTRGRTSIVVVLILALLGTAGARYVADNYREQRLARGRVTGQDSAQSLSNMSSYALALLLGGLRGPLVMILWTSSESQKADKNLEDFDTKVEWIRLLQPEFDSVHIFQIWNKAYNISVQMASLANKYSAILDALDYAQKVNEQRPNDINIVLGIADVYFNKLGNSSEKDYYRKRVRDETKWREVKGLKRGDVGYRRVKLDPILDAQGNILPQFREEYKYLLPYEPFPYGLSPFAISFNYYRAGQLLQKEQNQRHLQISASVVDSRPALTLRNWAEEEWEDGRKLELRMFGKPIPEERLDMELPTADVALDAKPVNAVDTNRILYSYALASELAKKAALAYEEHLRNPEFNVANVFTYQSHLDHVHGEEHLTQADHDYMAAMLKTGGDRKQLLENARKEYQEAIRWFRLNMLKWYTDDGLITRLGASKANMDKLSPEELGKLMDQLNQLVKTNQAGPDMNRADRDEYERYVRRSQERLTQIAKAIG
jgi:hypothetical protein